MKLLLPLLLVLIAGCSDAQAVSDPQLDGNPQEPTATSQPMVAMTGRVTDAANIIDVEREAALSKRLDELEWATKHQMVIVTVRTLNGQDVAAFTRDLANAWGIGRTKHDDGVVLLVAPNEQKVRIAVGYGLEQTLTDPFCQAILDEHVLPSFREGDLQGGIEAGASALIDRLKKP